MLDILVIRSLEELEAAKVAWNDLHLVSGAGPFVSHAWLTSWCETFLTDQIQMQIVTAWEGDTLLAAVPLAIRKIAITPRLKFYKPAHLTFLTTDRVGFHDMLMRPGADAAMAQVYEACKGLGVSYSDLTPVKHSEATAAFLACARRDGAWIFERDEIENTIAFFDGDLDDYLSTLSAGTRKKFRQLERRMADAGATMRSTGGVAPEDYAVVEDALDVSARSWKAINGTDVGSNSVDRDFMRRLYDKMAPLGQINVIVLEYDNQVVAAGTTLYSRGRCFGLISDYDHDFAAVGVGRYITNQTMVQAFEDKATEFDFLRATHFTRSFGQRTEHFVRIRLATGPSLARWVISAEALLRRGFRRIAGPKSKLTGRLKALKG